MSDRLTLARGSCENTVQFRVRDSQGVGAKVLLNSGRRSSGWSPSWNTFQYCGHEWQGEESEIGLQHCAAVPGAGRCSARVESEPMGLGCRKARSLPRQACHPCM